MPTHRGPPPDPALTSSARVVVETLGPLLHDASRRARFFASPCLWLQPHGGPGDALLDAYAVALAGELAGLSRRCARDAGPGIGFGAEAPIPVPTWLLNRSPGAPRAGVAAAPCAPDVRMAAVALITTLCACMLTSSASAMTNAVAMTALDGPSPPPPIPRPE